MLAKVCIGLFVIIQLFTGRCDDSDTPVTTDKFVFKCDNGKMLSAVRALGDDTDGDTVQVQASCQEPPVLCGTESGDPIPAEKWTADCSGKTTCGDDEYLNGFDYGGSMFCCKFPKECHSSGTTRRYTLYPQSSIKFNPRRRKGQAGERDWQQAILRDIVALSSNERKRRQALGEHAPPLFHLTVDEIPGIVVLAPFGQVAVQSTAPGPPTPGQAIAIVPCVNGFTGSTGCSGDACSSSADCRDLSCTVFSTCTGGPCAPLYGSCYGSSTCSGPHGCCPPFICQQIGGGSPVNLFSSTAVGNCC